MQRFRWKASKRALRSRMVRKKTSATTSGFGSSLSDVSYAGLQPIPITPTPSPVEVYGRGKGVGRGRVDGPGLAVGVGRGVPVGDAVAVAVGVAVAVAVGVGVGVPPPLTAAKISTRPQPYTLFGGPASPH